MKKITCLVLTVLMALSAVPAFAADSDGLQNAILTVKSRIDIPSELSEFSSNMYAADNGIAKYSLEWSTPSESVDNEALSITIDQNGYVTDYGCYNSGDTYYSGEIKLPKFSREQLEQKAVEFFRMINPDLSDEFVLSSTSDEISGYASNIRVRLYRYINGLKFCDDSATIIISSETGEVYSMYVTLTYCNNIPEPNNVISPEQAQINFNELSPMKAEYVTQSDDKAVLVYKPEDRDLMINAVTGEQFKYSSGYSENSSADYAAETAGFTGEAAAAGGAALSEAEMISVDQIGGLLSVDELRGIAESMQELGIDGSQYIGCNYSRNTKNADESYDYTADLCYSKYDGDTIVSNFYIELDAQSGELISFIGRGDSIKVYDVPTLTEAQALAAAKSFAEKYSYYEYINSNSELEASDTIDTEQRYYYNYSFAFKRSVNGFDYGSNYLQIGIDKHTGNVIWFYKSWSDDVEFEPIDNMISADEAFTNLMSQTGLELKYEKTSTDGINYNAVPVYELNTDKPSCISAITGKLVNYNGTEYTDEEKNTTASDISGHYAEAQIQTLLNYGILSLEEGETAFRPDDAITQGELLAFVAALNGRSFPTPLEYEAVYSYARNNGIVKGDETADSSAFCIREDGPKYIIRALGYENIAEMNGIFVTGFADSDLITSGAEGYVALAKGFGIVGGNPDNTFAPQELLTRADAAIMIYNYLAR